MTKARQLLRFLKGISLRRSGLVAVALVFAVVSTLQFYQVADARDYEAEKSRIQSQIDEYQAQIKGLNAQQDSYQKELDSLTAQKNIIQQQIDLKQAEFDHLTEQIAQNEKKIEDNKNGLGVTLADLYVSNDISPFEMLMSSSNIGDYVDKESYQNTIKDNLVRTINVIKDTKQKLEEQKKDVTRVLAEQKMARDALTGKEQEQANLISQTQGEAAAYSKLVSAREQQMAEVMRAQQAEIEAAARRGGSINVLPGDPNKGGYPWEGGCWLDAYAWSHGGTNGNGNDPLGYGCRQCVSYTAWKVGQRTGNFPMYWGNANMWPASAAASGYSYGRTPKPNSVGVIMAGQYGHVVWVEAVNGDGTVDISQYNYYNAGGPGWGNYSRMRVSQYTYDYYIYF